MIVHQNGQATFCFKPTNPERPNYGWCHTEGNYYDAQNPKDSATGSRQWGYCSKDCYLNATQTSATLRKVESVQVTSEPSRQVVFLVQPCHGNRNRKTSNWLILGPSGCDLSKVSVFIPEATSEIQTKNPLCYETVQMER